MDSVFNVLQHHRTVLGFASGRLFHGNIFRLRSRFQGLQEAPHMIMVGLAGFVVRAFEVA